MNSELMTVNFGPQHPSTHGVFRLRITLDGETVVGLEPVFGYLHRGSEKLAEERTFTQVITLTDRMDYTSAMTNNQAYVLSCEKLMEVTPPVRAQYLRVISAELSRIASHLIGTGFLINDLGAFITPLMYCFRERERILELFEMLCGARITLTYMRVGGVFQDTPAEFWPALDSFLTDMEFHLDEYESLLTGNEILLSRTVGVSSITTDQALNASITGPILRATGFDWDLRTVDPYEVYNRVNFEVPTGKNGDNYDRYLVVLKK